MVLRPGEAIRIVIVRLGDLFLCSPPPRDQCSLYIFDQYDLFGTARTAPRENWLFQKNKQFTRNKDKKDVSLYLQSVTYTFSHVLNIALIHLIGKRSKKYVVEKIRDRKAPSLAKERLNPVSRPAAGKK